MKLSGTRVYRFDQYSLEVAEHRLKRGETEISLQPKAFETLVYLVERRGHLVKKNELLDAVWAGVAVTEGALSLRIKEIRQALEDDAKRPRYIRTIPTIGYKFIADVEQITDTDGPRESRAGDIREQSGKPNEIAVEAGPTRVASKRLSRTAVLALAGTVVLLGLTFAAYSLRSWRPVSPLPIQSLAVLPFKPLVPSDRDEVLEMAMADSLITGLNSIGQVIVRPLSAVRSYTSLEQDAVAAGREQEVDAVLDSSIQRSGNRIRVTVKLVRVEDEKQLWADQFDEEFTNVFSVQDSISEQIVRALALELTGGERVLFTKHSTQNSDAYEFYMLGRLFWAQGTEAGITTAIGHFQQAIKIDSKYARAYAGLADSYILLGSHGLNSIKDSSEKARNAASKALELDEQLGEAHVSMGSIVAGSRDWAQAEKHYKRAVELIPNDEAAHCWYSQHLADAGRFDEAFQHAKQAQRIAPKSGRASHSTAYVLYMSKQFPEARDQSLKTLELFPNYLMAHIILGLAYVQMGNHAEAISSLQQARQLSGSPDFLALQGYAHAMAGKRNEALSVLKELKELSKKRYVSSFPVAMIYTGLGERKQAIESLQRANMEQAAHLDSLRVDPAFESLRSEPQFTQLLRQIGL